MKRLQIELTDKQLADMSDGMFKKVQAENVKLKNENSKLQNRVRDLEADLMRFYDKRQRINDWMARLEKFLVEVKDQMVAEGIIYQEGDRW